MQREPLLGLLETVVEKLVVELPGAERAQQIAAHGFRKLAGVDGHIDRG